MWRMHRVATPDHIMEAVVGNDRAGYVHNFIYKIIQWKNVPVKLARRNVYVFIRRAPSSFYIHHSIDAVHINVQQVSWFGAFVTVEK